MTRRQAEGSVLISPSSPQSHSVTEKTSDLQKPEKGVPCSWLFSVSL
jgi:hypothetical protein